MRHMTVSVRAAVKTTLTGLHTCALVVVTTRHRPCLLYTGVGVVSQLTRLVKGVRPLQHHPMLHGGLQATQEYIPGQRVVQALCSQFKL